MPFHHKMLCEGVCRTWRAILRCSQLHSSSTGSGLSGIWGKVTIKFEKEFPEQSRSIKCDGEWSSHTTFSVKASGCSLSQQERTFVAWMRQRSVGAESINLWCDFYTQDPGWVFAELVLAISSSGGQFSAQPPVTLESGVSTLRSLKGCELLAGSLTSWRDYCQPDHMTAEAGMQLAQNLSTLTRLTHLSLEDHGHLGDLQQLTALCQLRTLHVNRWAQAPHRGQHLTHLQELHIDGIHAAELDLSNCTQLTFLDVTLDHLRQQLPVQPLQRLILPFGPDVSLQRLTLTSMHIKTPFVLENLSQALSITHITFIAAFPVNLIQGDWPCSLPQLQSVHFSESDYSLPQQFLGCLELNDLRLEHYAANHLPDWFSGLTQLTSLHMSACKFESFPASVLCLSKLKHLSIDSFPAMTITKDILQVAAWCCLENLDLSVMDPVGNHSYSLDSQLYLLDLCQCLIARDVEVDVAVYPVEADSDDDNDLLEND